VIPQDIQSIGDELAIKWPDGTEQFLRLEALRRACPCAGCAGEKDIMGHTYRAVPQPLGPASYRLRRWIPIGGYGFQLFWEDGHNTGIYSAEYLAKIAGAPQ
jgi:DUF971 family protein